MNDLQKALLVIKFIFLIALIVLNILSIIWLFKVKNNSKKEPYPRDKYIIEGEDPLNYYTQGDFCYYYYNSYLTNGAFDDFDIRMTKIHKYSIVLICIFFINLILIILEPILNYISKRKKIEIIKWIFTIIKTCITILYLIFFTLLSVYYDLSKFGDFEDFSECKYFINTDFNKDYDFVFAVKRHYKVFFILTLITIGLDLISQIINMILR